MSAIAQLKAELKQISSVFPKSHPNFQVISASVDEVCCHFLCPNGKHVIQCTIMVRFLLCMIQSSFEFALAHLCMTVPH